MLEVPGVSKDGALTALTALTLFFPLEVVLEVATMVVEEGEDIALVLDKDVPKIVVVVANAYQY